MTDWKLYLKRPFSLLGCDLWKTWYASEIFKKYFGFNILSAYFIEYPQGVAWNFRREEDFSRLIEGTKKLTKEQIEECFDTAERLNNEAEELLKEQNDELERLISFHVALSIQATVIPYLLLQSESELSTKETERAEKMRLVKYYPMIEEELIKPAIARRLSEAGLPEEATEFTLISEVMEGDFTKVAERLAAHKRGESFLYKVEEGDCNINFMKDPRQELETLGVKFSETVNGRCAYPGKAKGRVRVVMGEEPSGHFDRDDILVSIMSSPTLMPFIEKAAAIVTDEGGAGCHAAIVSREMKIPCIVATGNATMMLKDGDLVEVDANNGTVKKV